MTRLLIGLTGGLYTFKLVANCGPEPVLPGVQPMAFAMDPSENGRVYCAAYNRGLWRSEDAGETWVPAVEFLKWVLSLKIHRHVCRFRSQARL
jgi:hypothetical protein